MDTEEYSRRFEKAYARLVEAHNFFFVWKALQKREYEHYWRGTSNFWAATISSLNQTWMLSLAKVYEDSSHSRNDEVISIASLVEHQPDAVRKDKAKDLLEKKKDLLRNIGIIRSHILAHDNAEHRITHKELHERYPIRYSEIEELLYMTEEIFHLLHPESNHSLSMEGFNEKCQKDVEVVMKKMWFWEEQRQKHYKRIEEGAPYSEFPTKE